MRTTQIDGHQVGIVQFGQCRLGVLIPRIKDGLPQRFQLRCLRISVLEPSTA